MKRILLWSKEILYPKDPFKKNTCPAFLLCTKLTLSGLLLVYLWPLIPVFVKLHAHKNAKQKLCSCPLQCHAGVVGILGENVFDKEKKNTSEVTITHFKLYSFFWHIPHGWLIMLFWNIFLLPPLPLLDACIVFLTGGGGRTLNQHSHIFRISLMGGT